MTEKKFIGIYFYNPVNGHKDSVDFHEVSVYAKKLPDVSVVWDHNDIATAYVDPLFTRIESVDILAAKIIEKRLKRIVVAGNDPGMAKDFFTKAMIMAGNKPDDVVLASFIEHCATRKSDTDRAKAIVACAANNIPFGSIVESTVKSVPLEIFVAPDEEVNISNSTLVIGGGIAGIQSSLEIADAGYQVYLVEKTGTIGGHVATFGKAFPTLDCSVCTLMPKMVEAGNHKNIKLMTYSEVKNVTGHPGDYKVKILNKARHVNLSTCISCGLCTEKCPVEVPSEIDSGTAMRKAVYIPFPQAVPNKYMIDKENCAYFKSKNCDVCSKVCPVSDCINYDEKDQEIEISVGNIIVATGYKPFDASRDDRLGYGKYPNVITSLEFERLVNPSGPTGGNIVLKVKDKNGNWIFRPDGKKPTSVAIIHCVGSRNQNYNNYCSKVCCMNSLKYTHIVHEKLPEAKVFEHFIDMRAYGKGHEDFYRRIRQEGTNILRGRTARIMSENNGKIILRSEDISHADLLDQEVDMIILAVGLEPRDDSKELAAMLDISQGEDGWFMESSYLSNPTGTYTGGVYIAGVCQGPKDIPDTVTQASAAAAQVLQSIEKGRIHKSIKDITLTQIENNIPKYSLMGEIESNIAKLSLMGK